jgi:lipid-binding SYLF domain-containing protein
MSEGDAAGDRERRPVRSDETPADEPSRGRPPGASRTCYAMFFMNAKAWQELDKANGFEVGVGPSVVVLDEGMAKTSTTKTMKDDIYAFIFGQKGLMAGLGIQGNKITRKDLK